MFRGEIYNHLVIDQRMLTLIHLQTAGQTAKMNTSMTKYLRVFFNHQQDDWVKWLSMAEFAVNDGASDTMQYTPFFPVYCTDPWTAFSNEPKEERDHSCAIATQVQATMPQDHEYLWVDMRYGQAVQEEGANAAQVLVPNIPEGSGLWLDAQHIHPTTHTWKLDSKRLGPFTLVIGICPYAFEFDLLVTIPIHQVQPVSLLDPVVDDSLPGQWVEPPPPVEVDGEEEYEVLGVEDSSIYRNWLQYLFCWTGYDSFI